MFISVYKHILIMDAFTQFRYDVDGGGSGGGGAAEVGS
jgi:hypothetical protein